MGRKHNYRVHINLLVLLLSLGFCLAVLTASWYYIHTRSQPLLAAEQPASLVAEGNMKTGTLHNPKEHQKEPNQIVEEGMLAFSINATPLMKDGASTANFLVESSPGDGKRFTITIKRDSTGEEIYQSGYLKPERYINYMPLDATLPKGEYPCIIYFDTYHVGDDTFTGRVDARITLYVLE